MQPSDNNESNPQSQKSNPPNRQKKFAQLQDKQNISNKMMFKVDDQPLVSQLPHYNYNAFILEDFDDYHYQIDENPSDPAGHYSITTTTLSRISQQYRIDHIGQLSHHNEEHQAIYDSQIHAAAAANVISTCSPYTKNQIRSLSKFKTNFPLPNCHQVLIHQYGDCNLGHGHLVLNHAKRKIIQFAHQCILSFSDEMVINFTADLRQPIVDAFNQLRGLPLDQHHLFQGSHSDVKFMRAKMLDYCERQIDQMVVQDIRGHHARLPYPKQVYEILGNWPNVANFYTQGTFQLNAQQRTIILGTIFAHQHAGVFQNAVDPNYNQVRIATHINNLTFSEAIFCELFQLVCDFLAMQDTQVKKIYKHVSTFVPAKSGSHAALVNFNDNVYSATMPVSNISLRLGQCLTTAINQESDYQLIASRVRVNATPKPTKN